MQTDAETLRARLRRGAVIVRIRLPSGPCWCSLVAVRGGRAGARLTVSVTGVPTRVSLESLLEVAEPSR
ncbi:MAG: hypothetical protein R3A48_15845 [Polyangiales bacterium]